MDINKIENHGKFSKTDAASKGKKPASTNGTASPADTDRVTLSDYGFKSSEKLFAKIELEKLNISSSKHLKELKAELTEFKNASKISSEEANKTEMGQKINDPSVWEDIANKMLK